ncbi:D-2-hydroxyacid dehydrogenase [Niveibacterium sp. SC-1]|uniref:D-2-hydroxyacid dehydrogenase n=1 Tax=Niveibacterium sp. SC-1 TaxID=3135646 RepID=UPI00311F18B8
MSDKMQGPKEVVAESYRSTLISPNEIPSRDVVRSKPAMREGSSMGNAVPKVVVLEAESIRARLARPATPHEWAVWPVSAPSEVVPRLQGAEAVMVNKIRLDRAVLDALPDLRMISVSATGTDNVDLQACRERGIVVSHVRDYAADAVPEHAMALMLALARNLVGYAGDVRGGEWARATQFCLIHRPVRDLSGGTLVIIGRGVLGDGLARRAEAFGMRVLFAEHRGRAETRPGYVPFDEALSVADVISLHCPLTEGTRGLIGERELARMKSSALLVNTARGALVDELALAAALREGRLAGAATDVLSQEPPRDSNPLLADDIPNLIVTPHMAWASESAMQRLADAAVANIDAYLRGAPQNRVA